MKAVSLLLLVVGIAEHVSCVSTVPTSLLDVSGVEVRFDWEGWPGTSAFVGWNESCEGRVPEYVPCRNVMEQPPRLTRHTLVEIEEYQDGEKVLVAFGGRSASGGLQTSSHLSNTVYCYHVRHAVWWLPFNDTFDDVMPEPRQSHVAWGAPLHNTLPTAYTDPSQCTNCRMLVHGGYGTHGNPLDDLWQYMNGTWTQLMTSSGGAPALAGHSAVFYDGNAYIYGGYGPGGRLRDELWVLDLNNLTWSVVEASGTRPTASAFHSAVLLPSNLTSPNSTVGQYEAWNQQANIMLLHGGLVVDGASIRPTNAFWKLSLTTMTWELVLPAAGGYRKAATNQLVGAFPIPTRSSHACYAVTHRMLCLGGWSSGVYSDFIEYDVLLNRITIPPFTSHPPSKLHGAAAVFSSGKSFLLGGTVGGSHGNFFSSPLFASFFVPPLCPPGRFSPDGDWQCFPCPAGHASVPYDCVLCSAGRYVYEDKKTCKECSPGHYTEGSGSPDVSGCLPCPAGTQLPAGGGASLDSCELCPNGTYSNNTGVGSCELCPAGTMGAMKGSNSLWNCEVCPYGTYSQGGSTECTTCPPGTQSSSFVRRLWPYALVIEKWGRDTTNCQNDCPGGCLGERCATCESNICSSCGPSPSSTFTVRSGQVVYFRIHAYETGTQGASPPTGMLRLQSATNNYMMRSTTVVTVEKQGGQGDLKYNCYANHPGACSSTPEGVAGGAATDYAGTSSSNECRVTTDAYQVWHQAVRLDAATPMTTLVFRSEALLAARLTVRVVGVDLLVTQQPPAYNIATQSLTVAVAYGDVLGNVDTTAEYYLMVDAPYCYHVVEGVVQSSRVTGLTSKINGGTASSSAHIAQGPLSNGKYSFSVAVSGPVFDDGIVGTGTRDGTMLQCHLRITATGGTNPFIDTNTFYVQQPKAIHVSHAILTYSGEPIKLHAEVHDADGLVVKADSLTHIVVRVTHTIPMPVNGTYIGNSTLEPIVDVLNDVVTEGQKTFYARLTSPSNALLRVEASQEYANIYVEHNDTVMIEARSAVATRLGIADHLVDPTVDPWPEYTMANKTFVVGVRAEDADGNLDYTADYLIGANITGCVATSVYLEEVNGTGLGGVMRLVLGRGSVSLRLVGENSDGCRLFFYHVPSSTDPASLSSGERIIAPLQTPVVRIRNPHHLELSWDVASCVLGTCSTCKVGVRTEYTPVVTLKTSDGTTMTWAEDVYVNMTTTGTPDEVAMLPAARFDSALALLVNGQATFKFMPLLDLNYTFTLSFQVGELKTNIERNLTYVLTGKGFGSFVTFEHEVDSYPAVVPWPYVDIYTACSLTTSVLAVELVVTTDAMRWMGSGNKHTITVEGRDSYGNRDVDLTGTMTAVVINCEGGLYTHPVFYWAKDASTKLDITNAAATIPVVKGLATMDIYGILPASHWEYTPEKISRGAKGCTLKVTMNPTPTGYSTLEGFWEPFELVQLTRVCTACPLGSWSPGGAGDTTNTEFAGGCTPCMAGTYSTKDKASSQDDCEVCPTGWGFTTALASEWDAADYKPLHEGLVTCKLCPAGSASSGATGGGSCTAVATSAVDTNPSGGSIGRRCTAGMCSGCVAGKYALTCATYTDATTCSSAETQGLCVWNSRCLFVNAVHEPTTCVDCPAGTVQAYPNNALGISSCEPCAQGSYSENTGKTEMVSGGRDPRACFDSAVVQACIGAGTGQCPDGTYGSKQGMTSAGDCKQCPAGTWSAKQYLQILRQIDPICRSADNPGSGYPLPQGTCTVQTGGCTTCLRGTTGLCQPCLPDFSGACTSTVVEKIGMDRCFLCPPGTYSLVVGATSSSTCITCPSGFFCPIGSSSPVPADVDASRIDTALKAMTAGGVINNEQRVALAKYPNAVLGVIPTQAYAFEGSSEPVYCDLLSGVPASHDSEGWVSDGHFSHYMWKEDYPNLFGPTASVGFTDFWGVTTGQVPGVRVRTDVDHTNPTQYYSDLCTASGGFVSTANYEANSGAYYCCASECAVGSGGPGCGTTAACSSALHSKCCYDGIKASQRVCGVISQAPCFIPGPRGALSGITTQSGSLEVNATYDRFVRTIPVGIENNLPIYVRLWGQNHMVITDYELTGSGVLNVTYGARWHLYRTAEEAANGSSTHTVATTLPVYGSPGAGVWVMADEVIQPPWGGPLHSIGIELFVEGGYEGYVLFDDVGVKIDPAFACNCSLGFFFNRTRVGLEGYTTPCQRCPPGYACYAGVLKMCPSGGYTQGGAYKCLDCPQGWLCNYDGRGTSTPCPAKTYEHEDESISRCLTCPLGYSCLDGKRIACNTGSYGDGSDHCILCSPGYYSNVSTAVIECDRCPPGHESNHMRTHCTECVMNSYSWNGTRCASCPLHQFTATTGSASCSDCLKVAAFPPRWQEVTRNKIFITLQVLPLKCIPGLEWRVLRYRHIGVALGHVVWANPPQVSTLSASYYLLDNAMGSDQMEFVVSAGVGGVEQTVLVTVEITNLLPVASPDKVTVRHPVGGASVVELTTLLENDHDPNNDELFIASYTWVDTSSTNGRHSITSVQIDHTRKKLIVTLPDGFKGPMYQLKYNVVDGPVGCVAPACHVSPYVVVNITAKDVPPVAVPDHFSVRPSETKLLNVLDNDLDADGDVLRLTTATKAAAFNNIETVPRIFELCAVCSTSCLSDIADLAPDLSMCLCDMDAATLECRPLVRNGTKWFFMPRFYIRYTAPPGFCGNDTFDYSIVANEDASGTTSVSVSVTQCICGGVTGGLEVMVVLDGTGGGTGWADLIGFAVGLTHRFDFSQGLVSMGLAQYAGYGGTAGVTLHRAMGTTSIETELLLTEQMGNSGLGSVTDDCPDPPCTEAAPILNALPGYFSASAKKVVVLITRHPFADPTLSTLFGTLTGHTLNVLTIDPSPPQYPNVAFDFHRHYASAALLAADQVLPAQLTDDICS